MTYRVLNREHMYKWCIVVGALYGTLSTADAGEAKPVTGMPMPSAQFEDLKGYYEFADRRPLTITGSTYKIRAQLDGRPEIALVRVGASTLQAADHSFTLIFEQQDNGTIVNVDLEERPGEKVNARPASAKPAD
jgi:hypothetical protein